MHWIKKTKKMADCFNRKTVFAAKWFFPGIVEILGGVFWKHEKSDVGWWFQPGYQLHFYENIYADF